LNSKPKVQNSKRSADWHCHLLPGVDDGPAHIDESVAMAAALQKAGFTGVYCTPHLIKGVFDVDNGAVRASLAALQVRLKDENIDLRLLPGREYYMDEFLTDYLKDPLPLGETRLIMIEIPNHTPEQFAREACFQIKRSGFIPMIAHPERCILFAPHEKRETARFRFSDSKFKVEGSKPNESSLLDYLSDLGCAFQANLGSFAAWYGPHVQQTANYLIKKEIYTHSGTDAHSPQGIEDLQEWGQILNFSVAKQF
jgi:protein-tyrosine phosphatase